MLKADMIIDLQFGSTGKGLIAGYLAETVKYDMVVNANMPNAGHTYINAEGRKWVHKVLPNGIVSPNLEYVMIGPGSIFNLDRLKQEMEDSKDLLRNVNIIMHENAVILNYTHELIEKKLLNHIASTMQGSSAAMTEKIRRHPDSEIMAKHLCHGDEWPPQITVVNSYEWLQYLYGADRILIEGAQGYSLGINAGFWPYCTSRDCTPARFLADCGVPHTFLDKVIGTARVHPIRVGNTDGGYSGGMYKDQEEINWKDIWVTPERTTVTGRVRRIFTFSRQQIIEAIAACRPDSVFLNFCNYDIEKAKEVREIIQRELNWYGGFVEYMGYGPTFNDIEVSNRERL